MEIAIIKNNICKNIAVFKDMDSAKTILINIDYDELVEINGIGVIGQGYSNGSWELTNVVSDETSIYCPQCASIVNKDVLNCPICGFDINQLR